MYVDLVLAFQIGAFARQFLQLGDPIGRNQREIVQIVRASRKAIFDDHGKTTDTVKLEGLIEKVVEFFKEARPRMFKLWAHTEAYRAADRSRDSIAALLLIGAREASDALAH